MSFDPSLGKDSAKRMREERVAGVRAVQKAIQNDLAAMVLVARDAEERVLKGLFEECKKKGIEIQRANTMQEIGHLCGLRVGAAACAILKSPKRP